MKAKKRREVWKRSRDGTRGDREEGKEGSSEVKNGQAGCQKERVGLGLSPNAETRVGSGRSGMSDSPFDQSINHGEAAEACSLHQEGLEEEERREETRGISPGPCLFSVGGGWVCICFSPSVPPYGWLVSVLLSAVPPSLSSPDNTPEVMCCHSFLQRCRCHLKAKPRRRRQVEEGDAPCCKARAWGL